MYILGNRNLTIREYLEMTARLAGLEIGFIPLPVGMAKVAGWMFVKIADATGKPPLTTAKEVSYSSQHLFFDISKARQKLGYEPSSVEDSIVRALNWYRAEGIYPPKDRFRRSPSAWVSSCTGVEMLLAACGELHSSSLIYGESAPPGREASRRCAVALRARSPFRS